MKKSYYVVFTGTPLEDLDRSEVYGTYITSDPGLDTRDAIENVHDKIKEEYGLKACVITFILEIKPINQQEETEE